jgi:hypothetical protein
MSDETGVPPGGDGDDDAPVSPGTRVTGILLAAALLLVVGFAFVHVALKPVGAGAAAPQSHYPGPCWACHMVTSNTEGTDGP